MQAEAQAKQCSVLCLVFVGELEVKPVLTWGQRPSFAPISGPGVGVQGLQSGTPSRPCSALLLHGASGESPAFGRWKF